MEKIKANDEPVEIFGLMQERIGAVEVQRVGCRWLFQISNFSAANQVKVATLGGIEAVLAGMEAHPCAEEVQGEGCKVLNHLCCNADNKAKVAALGGVETVLVGMHTHADDEFVQEYGCMVLKDLCCDADIVNRMTALGTVREVVESAIAAHPSNSDVQNCGACVLDVVDRLA